jgi:hypothetical protein
MIAKLAHDDAPLTVDQNAVGMAELPRFHCLRCLASTPSNHTRRIEFLLDAIECCCEGLADVTPPLYLAQVAAVTEEMRRPGGGGGGGAGGGGHVTGQGC